MGEIDCRLDEGFLAASSNLNNKELDLFVYKNVKNYVSNAQKIFKTNRLIICNVPQKRDRYMENNISSEYDKKRLHNIVIYFNKALAQVCLSLNIEVLDLYTIFQIEDANSQMLDEVHFNNKGVLRIIQKLT